MVMKHAGLLGIAIIMINVAMINSVSDKVHPYRVAQTLDYNYIFNQKSDVSVVMVACGGVQKLAASLKSFFYFNTYLINKFYIAHCSVQQIAIAAALPYGYDANRQRFQIIQAEAGSNGIIDALQSIYDKINTKYIYQTDASWAMTKGFGFIEQAISILKYGSQKGMRISQVVTNYPFWRASARLTQLQWTDSGQAFHQIVPFNVSTYPFFTLSPSVIDFQNMFKSVIKQKLRAIALESNCMQPKFQFDKCALAAIGRQIYRNKYIQVYLNDGTGDPNHIFLEQ